MHQRAASILERPEGLFGRNGCKDLEVIEGIFQFRRRLHLFEYISRMTRPSSRIQPSLVMKSLIFIFRICAATLASIVSAGGLDGFEVVGHFAVNASFPGCRSAASRCGFSP